MNNFFCGWYFKCQSETQTLCLIPARHMSKGKTQYSIQILTEHGNWNIPVSHGPMHVKKSQPYAQIGDNFFSSQKIKLNINTSEVRVKGHLHFGAASPIRYDIMGPFCMIPFMECRHRVYSMRHRVTGVVKINEQEYRFDNAWGYIEGDSGRSFPRQYAWTHCFVDKGAIMLSVAEIPMGPVRFTGVISIIQLGTKEYRLATYLGAKAVLIGKDTIDIRQGPLRLLAQRTGVPGYALKAPVSGEMSRLIRENASCGARYCLTDNGKVLLQAESKAASFEFEY